MKSEVDFNTLAKGIDKLISTNKLIDFYKVEDTCKILEHAELNLDQAIWIFTECQKKYTAKQIFLIFQAVKMDSGENIDKINTLLNILRKCLNSGMLKYIATAFEHISKVYEYQKNDIAHLKAQLAEKEKINSSLTVQIHNVVEDNSNLMESLSKYLDASKNVPKIPKKMEYIPKQPDPENKYVKLLQVCKCNSDDFEKIYSILKDASQINDVDAIRFAILNNLSEVKDIEYQRTMFLMASNNGDFNLVKLLTENGCDIKVIDKYNRNALHLASIKNNVNIVAFLVNLRDININAIDNKFETSLHWASLYGNLSIVQILCQCRDIDINALDKDDETPLHKASYAGQIQIVQYLTSLKDIKLNPLNKQGKTPYQVVTAGKKDDVKAFLKSKGCQ
ncbi:ankyrin repeat protein, putative [Trichomonas vaginalis G3]|uniref:Ankyrin repeat protein, putative n=1 Tax=Trichomonas vaginalis (strain ATCC PRA-98 / G3) TaxID=412133 RepID=A2EMT4_TRIV3|nr:protein ubiquitination [Trichomonas vaginalis G3]EAY06007.1 ankyrin repeat protein, putative [Trichomonas vaginalis G3]KAI5512796.1 protein ubiquitination [Trichomonas vaginalis G3]|eukprot:XP_001318230.1 ankyrin repeat protein [Trichomonas vaginalis G3]